MLFREQWWEESLYLFSTKIILFQFFFDIEFQYFAQVPLELLLKQSSCPSLPSNWDYRCSIQYPALTIFDPRLVESMDVKSRDAEGWLTVFHQEGLCGPEYSLLYQALYYYQYGLREVEPVLTGKPSAGWRSMFHAEGPSGDQLWL
jgi:hypothetical protein